MTATNYTSTDISQFITNIIGEFTKAIADNAALIVLLAIATMLIGGVMALFGYLHIRK